MVDEDIVEGSERAIPRAHLQALESNFHAVIRQRAGQLIEQHHVELPSLERLVHSEDSSGEDAWFPVPGMYGGFAYHLQGAGVHATLQTESWCRVVGGSGQRHIITAEGSELVADGFV